MFDLKKMFLQLNWTNLIIKSIIDYKSIQDSIGIPNWEAELNDQDIFNIIILQFSELFLILPCEWNVQFHARMNTLIKCHHHIIDNFNINSDNNNNNYNSNNWRDYFRENYVDLNNIPYNCEESRKSSIFVCEKKAKVIHFMAQSYKNGIYNFAHYYSFFWESYNDLKLESLL